MTDLISRQAAIEALHDEIVSRRISEDTNDDGALDEFDTEAILRRLPSAQPDLQQTCNQLATDCISRQDAIDALDCINGTKEVLRSLPSAQPDDWMERNKERILQAGMEGREIEFRIGGRLFAIREKAQ